MRYETLSKRYRALMKSYLKVRDKCTELQIENEALKNWTRRNRK